MTGLAAPDRLDPPADPPAGATRGRRRYDVHGIRLLVTSDVPGALDRVDDTYGAFASSSPEPAGTDPRREFALLRDGDGARLTGPAGEEGRWPSPAIGIIALFDRLVGTVIAELHRQGVYAIHAGAVADERGAIVVAGRSGQGKTTLTLGLLSRGRGLLSDELALVDPATGLVLPYRRSVHVRPPTIALLPALAELERLPRQELGGGSEWAVLPADISRLLGAADLPGPTPLGAIVILDGTPDPAAAPRLEPVGPAVAALELLRGTWAASVDFGGTLSAVIRAIETVPCARLAAGPLDATLDMLLAWRASGGR